MNDKTLKSLNWGALGVTPLWCLINGFWLTTAIYLVAFLKFPIAALAISFILFIKGTEWSWADGKRWKDFEEFEKNMIFTNSIAIIGIVFQVFIYGIELYDIFYIYQPTGSE